MLAINVSGMVSGFCYSVLKVETYSDCYFDCQYCYGRWYRVSESVEPQFKAVREFAKVAFKLSKLKLPIIPFRMSTLIDPFQPAEKKYRLSLKVMRIALKNEIPLIISTKSTLLTENSWFKLLTRLAEKKLTLLQVTITTLDEKLSKLLEPRAPAPSSRIEAIEKAVSENVPVVLRWQPLIPGIAEHEAKEVLETAKSLRVKHVILEFLRCQRNELNFYRDIAYSKEPYQIKWEPYSLSRENVNIVRPSIAYRDKTLKEIHRTAKAIGVKIALCKEELLQYETVENCCGINYLKNTVLRLTLREAWKLYRSKKAQITYENLLKEYGNNEKYLTPEKLKDYPRVIRRPLLHHEKTLANLLSTRWKLITEKSCKQ